ncbi:uncharacterized protein LOC114165566 [Vigna unguiculata]|uniref:uncharacterized protein LOC114165566 n=1 Tax=Vigna unguiculata TaxID=3917 RepID=UPI001015DDB6|nr:uncharacterized protein LOC114165566 [Vigna unguiculata]
MVVTTTRAWRLAARLVPPGGTGVAEVLEGAWHLTVMANRRRRNDVGIDEIAHAIHKMVDEMQPVAVQPRAMVPPARAVTMEDVLRHKPAKFSDKATPDEAQQLMFTTFLLVGDAEYWWTGMQEQMQTRQEEVNWVYFQKRFLEKYFSDSAKHALEAEFLTLQQGNRSVQACVDRFEYLTKFYSQAITEELRYRKFEDGLKHELRRFLVPLRIKEFPILVEHARTGEELEIGPSRVMKTQKNTSDTRNCTKAIGSLGGTADNVKCYNYEQMGHYARQCPNKKPAEGTPQQNKQQKVLTKRLRAAGRVFALTSTDAIQSGNLILDKCLLFNHSVLLLFDSGATHSFVSKECVSRLGLVVCDLGCDLTISTPASGQVSTNSVCVGCSIEVARRRFKVNLICLPLEGLNVILGMDWLSNNHVVIDCRQRSVIFPKSEGLTLISTREAQKEETKGASYFMIVVQTEKKSTTALIRSIPVVDEYVDVFLNEVLGLPPSRNVDFAIELIPGVGPVSMAPYRMAPVELAELKKQIEDLLEKKFFRPSASPWGAPVLLVKKKDESSRLCVDYRQLNKLTIKNKYPIPRIDDLLDQLRGAWYSLKLIYGLGIIRSWSNPRMFRRLSSGLDMNREEHPDHLRVVLNVLREHQLNGKLSKCEFWLEKVQFLGHVISPQGFSVDPAKIDTVMKWERPQTVSE